MRIYGNRFIFGFEGLSPKALLTEMITENRVSGVILFARNIGDGSQVAALCAELQDMRRRMLGRDLQGGRLLHRL
ncbi:MAG: hypothetical protein NT045_07225 [Candidatus Aureabacteria bacterium]|nr:hypothetical protein [Candidatus Auribacterota bacterium]